MPALHLGFLERREEDISSHRPFEPWAAFLKRDHIESAQKFRFVMVVVRQRTPSRLAVRKIPKDLLGQFRLAREDPEAPCENPETGVSPFLELRGALALRDIFGPLGSCGDTQLA
jgi:hypothetical protein